MPKMPGKAGIVETLARNTAKPMRTSGLRDSGTDAVATFRSPDRP